MIPGIDVWTFTNDAGGGPTPPDPETSGNVGVALGFRIAFSIALILIGV